MLDLSLYDYELPRERIALYPASERDASRLLVMARGGPVVGHHVFRDLPRLLRAGDLLVLNDTLAFPARLWGRKIPTGGQVEILLLRPEKPGTWEVLWRPHRRVKVGARAEIRKRAEIRTRAEIQAPAEIRGTEERAPGEPERAPSLTAEVVGVSPRGHLLARFHAPAGGDVTALLDELGEPPLPPYIKRAAVPEDRERYQTVFARERGSIAAPTAGLHFTAELLAALRERGIQIAMVTLHVGLSTFQPVTPMELSTGELGDEHFEVSRATARLVNETRAAGGRIVAVGTSSVRTLESAWEDDADPAAEGSGRLKAFRGWTRRFIYPPYRFRAVDALITNFHLPRSTLILLAAAFAGRESLLAAYAEALAQGYRFASYGDAMLIE